MSDTLNETNPKVTETDTNLLDQDGGLPGKIEVGVSKRGTKKNTRKSARISKSGVAHGVATIDRNMDHDPLAGFEDFTAAAPVVTEQRRQEEDPFAAGQLALPKKPVEAEEPEVKSATETQILHPVDPASEDADESGDSATEISGRLSVGKATHVGRKGSGIRKKGSESFVVIRKKEMEEKDPFAESDEALPGKVTTAPSSGSFLEDEKEKEILGEPSVRVLEGREKEFVNGLAPAISEDFADEDFAEVLVEREKDEEDADADSDADWKRNQESLRVPAPYDAHVDLDEMGAEKIEVKVETGAFETVDPGEEISTSIVEGFDNDEPFDPLMGFESSAVETQEKTAPVQIKPSVQTTPEIKKDIEKKASNLRASKENIKIEKVVEENKIVEPVKPAKRTKSGAVKAPPQAAKTEAQSEPRKKPATEAVKAPTPDKTSKEKKNEKVKPSAEPKSKSKKVEKEKVSAAAQKVQPQKDLPDQKSDETAAKDLNSTTVKRKRDLRVSAPVETDPLSGFFPGGPKQPPKGQTTIITKAEKLERETKAAKQLSESTIRKARTTAFLPAPDTPFAPAADAHYVTQEIISPVAGDGSPVAGPSLPAYTGAYETAIFRAPSKPRPDPILKAEGLCKRFGGREVVTGIDVEVGPGEIVGLLGRNGAGKTTSFRMVVGMLRPDSGAVHFDGENITKRPMYARARLGLGYLAQEPSIFQKLTVEDNLMAVLEMQERDSKVRVQSRDELIHELGLETVRKSVASTLSGGERRRLEIARTMILKPRIVLFDEPFAGIDPIAVTEIQDILRDLKASGVGVLITDHNVRETLNITDRTYIMDEGQIWIHGTPREIVNNPEARDRYLGHGFRLDF